MHTRAISSAMHYLVIHRVVLLEAGKVPIDMDGGTQDLSVRFEDPNAGYNLSKGTMLEVQFVMRSAGGCFLPFSGDSATVVSIN